MIVPDADIRDSSKWAIGLAAVLLLVVYLATLAPTITWAHHGADSGDLVTAVVLGRIPHPPGCPAYLLLGELFIHWPGGGPAWRLNLMSAVMAMGGAALTAAAVGRLSTGAPLPALGSALGLGLAPLFWSQAVIAEVYAPAAFFVGLVLYLAVRGGMGWGLGLAWGVGLGVHPTLLFLAPLVVWGLREEAGLFPNIRPLGLAALGWGLMYGPALLARRAVPSPWADLSSLGGWWGLVSGRMYHGYLFGLPTGAWPTRMLAWVGLLVRQFTPVGAGLAAWGWGHLWRTEWRFALAAALTGGAFSLYAIGYDTADSLVYVGLALPVAAVGLGVGWARAADWLRRRWRWGVGALLVLPILQAVFFWGSMDLSADREAAAWAERVLGQAPVEGVLLTAQDGHTFALWYVRDVLGERPDVVVLDRDLWAQSPYRRLVGSELGLNVGELDGVGAEDAARLAGRPVQIVTGDEE